MKTPKGNEVRIGLQDIYADCLADDSRASRTTTSDFMARLVEDASDLTAQLAESHLQVERLNALVSQQETFIAEQRKRIDALEQQLAQLQWVPLTDSVRFDKKLDYVLYRDRFEYKYKPMVIRGDEFQRAGAAHHLICIGWTHYRPINPPQPTAPVAGERV